jgi:nifR3 family TIM-barrel protein
MKLVLAPLAGFTDAPFRRMCFDGGADFAYTEMVSAAGLAHGSSPTLHLMEVLPGEGPLACQIFGSRESDVAYAAKVVSQTGRFKEINLNAGCPMQKVTREGAGAKLIEDPRKIEALLRAMVEKTDLPVTLKTRIGPHPQCTSIFKIAELAERAGASGLIVHARYTSQMHGGSVHYDVLKELVERTSLPVVGNGSVTNANELAQMASTGVHAVMIGRAALAHPMLFSELKGVSGGAFTAASLCRKHLGHILAFREQLAREFPGDHVPSADGFASVKMHTHLFRYFNGRPGAAALRARLNTVRSLAEIMEIIANEEGND